MRRYVSQKPLIEKRFDTISRRIFRLKAETSGCVRNRNMVEVTINGEFFRAQINAVQTNKLHQAKSVEEFCAILRKATRFVVGVWDDRYFIQAPESTFVVENPDPSLFAGKFVAENVFHRIICQEHETKVEEKRKAA